MQNTESHNTRESYHTESQTHSIKTESQQSQPDSIQTYYNNNETSYTLQAPHIQSNAPLPQYSDANTAQTTHTQYVDINEKSKHNDTDNVYNAAHTFHNNNTLHNDSHILQTTHTRPYNHSQKINQNGTHTLCNDADSVHNEIYTLQAPHIDYIIFLDSDDYWKPNCLEECLKHSEGVDIVWFFYDGIQEPKVRRITYWDYYNFTHSQKISVQDMLTFIIERNIGSFPFAPQGMIDFTFLKSIHLKFLDYIYAEDHHFGVLLLTQANSIYALLQKPYIYRIRPDSSSDYKTSKKSNVMPYLQDIYMAFNKNFVLTRAYFKASSWTRIALEIIQFTQNYANKERATLAQKAFLPYLSSMALSLANFPEDPMRLIPKLRLLRPYIGNARIRGFKKIALFYPKYYKFCIPFILLYRKYKIYREHKKTLR